MTLFQNKYRIESTRLQSWDYTRPAFYFVTICTHNRESWFGTISNGELEFNPLGEIVSEEWARSFSIRSELLIDESIIMPNHFHAIVHIADHVEKTCDAISTATIHCGHWKSGALGAIIGQFKQQVTKRIRGNGFSNFKWQTRFHDHIIRNEDELFKIRQYIKNNPVTWNEDCFHI